MRVERTKKKRNLITGFFVGSILGLLGKYPKTGSIDPNRQEFKNSTRRLGVSFTDRIRNVFRKKWLKKS